MPSFDVVSEVDLHQLTNAVDQATRVVANRYDFKGVDAGFERSERQVAIYAEADIQLQQMVDMLRAALIKRGEVREAVLYREDLLSADRLWVGNSVRGLLPAHLLPTDTP